MGVVLVGGVWGMWYADRTESFKWCGQRWSS
jgi:hypothetical protein